MKNLNAVHPYIPNSVPEVEKEMLESIGVGNLDDLFDGIPEDLRYRKDLDIPGPMAEYELNRHVEEVLDKNKSTNDYISFMGGGSWDHFVPAVCNTINQRAEFLTAYTGDQYQDHGRYQALFEYQSLVAELVGMDVVNVPTFDWGQAAATSIRMASRITSRNKVLVPHTISPERYKVIENYCSPDIEIVKLKYCEKTGQLDSDHIKKQIASDVAAIYFENPSYLGFMEQAGKEISETAKQAGALTIVGVDPSSLGVFEPPSQYGADIVCGELQPLGIHMSFGGGQSGFIATRNEEKYIQEYPSRLIGLAPTIKEGEYGFGEVLTNRTSLIKREKGKEFVGTQTSLWAITAGVYLSLMGPKGMYELGQTILQKSQYAINQLQKIESINASRFGKSNFKEFVVDFNNSGKTVAEIRKELLAKGIFAGIDLSKDFPEFGESALFCITEVHSKEDIDKLVKELSEILSK